MILCKALSGIAGYQEYHSERACDEGDEEQSEEEGARAREAPRRPRSSKKTRSVKESLCEGTPVVYRLRKGVDIGDDRLTASIEQPVLITRCVFHTLLQGT